MAHLGGRGKRLCYETGGVSLRLELSASGIKRSLGEGRSPQFVLFDIFQRQDTLEPKRKRIPSVTEPPSTVQEDRPGRKRREWGEEARR